MGSNGVKNVIGANLSEHQTSVVYGTTCINWPRPSHSREEVPGLSFQPRSSLCGCLCFLIVSFLGSVTITTTHCNVHMWAWHGSLAVWRCVHMPRLSMILALPFRCCHSPWLLLAGHFTQTLFHTFLHKYNTSTLHSGHEMHTGVHRPHPLA